MNKLSKYWDFYIILLFLIIRLILNIPTSINYLTIFFFISYLILIMLLIYKKPYFIRLSILFLVIDSLIGTYIFYKGNILPVEYLGTMIVNLIAIVLIYLNRSKSFQN